MAEFQWQSEKIMNGNLSDMENLKKRLKEILVHDLKIQGLRPEELDENAPLFDGELGLDSLDAVELVVLVQKYFNVRIADREEGTRAFVSVNSLAEFIREKQAGRTG
jgi:acyl carrier protein